MSIARSFLRQFARVALIAACVVLVASCGGDSKKAAPTRMASGPASLIYVAYRASSADPTRPSMMLFDQRPGSEATLIHEYTADDLAYLLASPDGTKIALIDNGIMNIVDRADGSDLLTLDTAASSVTGAGPLASWTPDSKLFAYSRINRTGTPIADIPNSIRSGWIEIADVDTKNVVTPAWTKAVPAANPSWSPRGDEFVAVDYGNVRDTNRALIIGGLDGKRSTLTAEPIGPKAMPVWSPDAKHIAYWVPQNVQNSQGETVPAGVFVVDENGKNARFLAFANFITPQAWSPDGKELAIACGPEHETSPTPGAEGTPAANASISTNICLVDVVSGEITRLTSGTSEFSPAFSPDGDVIAYLTTPEPGSIFTLKTIRVSDRQETTISTDVPLGGMTWAAGTAPVGGAAATP